MGCIKSKSQQKQPWDCYYCNFYRSFNQMSPILSLNPSYQQLNSSHDYHQQRQQNVYFMQPKHHQQNSSYYYLYPQQPPPQSLRIYVQPSSPSLSTSCKQSKKHQRNQNTKLEQKIPPQECIFSFLKNF